MTRILTNLGQYAMNFNTRDNAMLFVWASLGMFRHNVWITMRAIFYWPSLTLVVGCRSQILLLYHTRAIFYWPSLILVFGYRSHVILPCLLCGAPQVVHSIDSHISIRVRLQHKLQQKESRYTHLHTCHTLWRPLAMPHQPPRNIDKHMGTMSLLASLPMQHKTHLNASK